MELKCCGYNGSIFSAMIPRGSVYKYMSLLKLLMEELSPVGDVCILYIYLYKKLFAHIYIYVGYIRPNSAGPNGLKKFEGTNE